MLAMRCRRPSRVGCDRSAHTGGAADKVAHGGVHPAATNGRPCLVAWRRRGGAYTGWEQGRMAYRSPPCTQCAINVVHDAHVAHALRCHPRNSGAGQFPSNSRLLRSLASKSPVPVGWLVRSDGSVLLRGVLITLKLWAISMRATCTKRSKPLRAGGNGE